MKNKWYKDKPTDRFWWCDNGQEVVGEFLFTFDKIHVFNLFRDYPFKLTKEQKQIFDEDTEYYWAVFFKDRK